MSYIDFGSGYTVAAIQKSIDADLRDIASVDPRDLGYLANSVQRSYGQRDAIDRVTERFADIIEYSEEQGYSQTHRLALQFAELANLALRPADDTWSGRNNDARRSYHDGWVDAIQHVKRKVEAELAEIARAVKAAKANA